MTTLIIESDSDKKTELLIQFAQELGLDAKTQEFRKLTDADMVTGIGRKATDEELLNYLSEDHGAILSIEEVFSKYLNK